MEGGETPVGICLVAFAADPQANMGDHIILRRYEDGEGENIFVGHVYGVGETMYTQGNRVRAAWVLECQDLVKQFTTASIIDAINIVQVGYKLDFKYLVYSLFSSAQNPSGELDPYTELPRHIAVSDVVQFYRRYNGLLANLQMQVLGPSDGVGISVFSTTAAIKSRPDEETTPSDTVKLPYSLEERDTYLEGGAGGGSGIPGSFNERNYLTYWAMLRNFQISPIYEMFIRETGEFIFRLNRAFIFGQSAPSIWAGDLRSIKKQSSISAIRNSCQLVLTSATGVNKTELYEPYVSRMINVPDLQSQFGYRPLFVAEGRFLSPLYFPPGAVFFKDKYQDFRKRIHHPAIAGFLMPQLMGPVPKQEASATACNFAAGLILKHVIANSIGATIEFGEYPKGGYALGTHVKIEGDNSLMKSFDAEEVPFEKEGSFLSNLSRPLSSSLVQSHASGSRYRGMYVMGKDLSVDFESPGRYNEVYRLRCGYLASDLANSLTYLVQER